MYYWRQDLDRERPNLPVCGDCIKPDDDARQGYCAGDREEGSDERDIAVDTMAVGVESSKDHNNVAGALRKQIKSSCNLGLVDEWALYLKLRSRT